MQHSAQTQTGYHPETSSESQSGGEDHTVSVILRGAREKRQEDVGSIARTLRINRRYLEALEDGRFEDLPGTVYAIGFIRSYADHLDLDSESLILKYKQANEGGTRKTRLDFPEPLPETGLPGGAILFTGIVVALLAYGGWYFVSENDAPTANLVASVPKELAQSTGVESITEAPADKTPTDQTTESSNTVPDAVEQNQATVKNVTETEATEPESGSVMEESSTAGNEAPTDTVDGMAENVQESTDVAAEPMMESANTAEPVVSGNNNEDPASGQSEQDISEQNTIVAEAIATEDGGVDTQSLNEQQLRAVQASLGGGFSDAVSNATAPDVDSASEEPPEAGAGATDLAAVGDEISADEGAEDGTPRVYGDTGDVRIIITATTSSWVEIRDTVSDELLLTRLLRTGDSFRVPDRPNIVLATGNAGGLEITVDGEVVSAVGDAGDVRRDVSLDPGLLATGDTGN